MFTGSERCHHSAYGRPGFIIDDDDASDGCRHRFDGMDEAARGLRVVRIVSGQDAIAWADVVAAGFDLPRRLASLLSPGVHKRGETLDAAAQFFGVGANGRLVATSMLYLDQGIAGVHSVATLLTERAQGLGAPVTVGALRAGHELGYGVGVLRSSSAGHSVYRTLGFRDVGSVPMFVQTVAI